MPDLTDIQASQSVKIAGVDPATGLENNWIACDLFGSMQISIRDSSGNLLIGQRSMSQSIPVTLASDQTPIIITPQPPVNRRITGNISALNGFVSLNCEGISSVILGISGTWSAVLQIEGTVDNTNWYPVTFIDLETNSQVLSINDNGLFQVPTAGYRHIRIRAIGYSSGTVSVVLEGCPGNFSIFSLQSSQGFNSEFSFGDVNTAAIARFAVRRTTYTEQTTNGQRSINSTSANDSATGTGARSVTLRYYDQNGYGPYYETVTLNGTANVNTVATNIAYIEKMIVETVGSGGSNAGTITLRSGINGGGVTIGTINPGDNRTFWAIHYVPAGRVCRVTGISCSHNGTTVGSGAIFTLAMQPIGVANKPEQQVSDFVRLYGQSSTFSRVYQSPIVINGPARLQMYVLPESSSSITYRASFDYFE